MRVYVINDAVAPILKGMEGDIIGSSMFNGKKFYHIRATNNGPKMITEKGEKPTRAWKEGDIRKLVIGNFRWVRQH